MDTTGGGSAICFNNMNVSFQQIHQINKDCSIHRLILGNLKVLWLGSIYLNQGTADQIKHLVSTLKNLIPMEERKFILLVGDFNVNMNVTNSKSKLLSELAKTLQLTVVTPSKNTTRRSTLDFIIKGRAIHLLDHKVIKAPSDHASILWNLTIDCPKKIRANKLPNTKMGKEITLKAIQNEKSRTAIHLLKDFLKRTETLGDKAVKHVTYKQRHNSYQKFLLELEEDDDAIIAIKTYWKDFWRSQERLRYSIQSKEAYNTMKNILKYHTYAKRDGSIVNCFKLPDDSIIDNPKEVSRILIGNLKKTQENPNMPRNSNCVPFPDLPDLDDGERLSLLNSLSSGKAISWDLFSDNFLKNKKAKEEFAKKLTGMWSSKLNQVPNIDKFFRTRLVPLNKAHPNIPTPDQFRPIVIMSPIVKILEARFLPKLNKHMLQRILPSQTGFVQGQGTHVNIFRAIQRIKLRTDQKKKVYGLFIDLKSAYNHIRHDSLFERLANVLTPSEVQFVRAIYSRTKIEHGEYAFKPNTGVAQGSMISPSLFNISLDQVLKRIVRIVGISIEDVLVYADDILILVDDLATLNKILKCLDTILPEENLRINKAKSGIINFRHRRSKLTKSEKRWRRKQNFSYKGYPLVQEYKYLGTILNEKLTIHPQMKFIRKKSFFIGNKLKPLLSSSSLESRYNLWQIFIAPLFEYLIPLLSAEKYPTHHLNVERLMRATFRHFTYLAKITPIYLIDQLTNYK